MKPGRGKDRVVNADGPVRDYKHTSVHAAAQTTSLYLFPTILEGKEDNPRRTLQNQQSLVSDLWLHLAPARGKTRPITWLLVKTLKMCSSESGAKPWHSLMLAMTPATNVPCPKPARQDTRQAC